MVFETARRAGWLTDEVERAHVAFGSVLGPDGKPFKTRSGDTAQLMELLDEAVDRARDAIATRPTSSPIEDLDPDRAQAGIGAVKYADLSTSRIKDYIFDLGPDGVVQRQYRRLSAVRAHPDPLHPPQGRRRDRRGRSHAPLDPRSGLSPARTHSATPSPRSAGFEPHRLCGSSLRLAKAFTDFYEACPVLPRCEPVRANRSRCASSPGRPWRGGCICWASRHPSGCDRARLGDAAVGAHADRDRRVPGTRQAGGGLGHR